MNEPASTYGLLPIVDQAASRAVIVLHGIRQTREDLRPFSEKIRPWLSQPIDLYLYGYNHTQGLEENGRRLADQIDRQLSGKRIDLVGYSMGGLVARLAATERLPSPIHTVITVATPNRGSLSNAELTVLGQIGRSIFEMISPLVPRSEGVKDLTRVVPIMCNRRKRMLDDLPDGRLTASQRRYASIPGLYYNRNRTEFSFGPSIQISGAQAFIKLAGLRLKLVSMEKSHDGIVTEQSNDLTSTRTHEFLEVNLTSDATDGSPALCHAVSDTCVDHDHTSILKDERIAKMVAALINADDWRKIRAGDKEMDKHIRLHPFDIK